MKMPNLEMFIGLSLVADNFLRNIAKFQIV